MQMYQGATASPGLVMGPVRRLQHSGPGLERVVLTPGREQALLNAAVVLAFVSMDAFYAVCGDVLSGRLDEVSTLRKDEVYRYPLIDYTNPIFYDLGDYLVRMSRSDEEISRVKDALDDIVLYKICVNPFYNRGEIPADKFSGVNVFVPSAAWNYGNYYQTLSWFRVYGE